MNVKDILRNFTSWNRPVLSDQTIKRYIKHGKLFVYRELNENQFQPNSVDLTLGNTIKILNSNSDLNSTPIIDVKEEISYTESSFSKYHGYTLLPHEFVLMASHEVLRIPNGIIAFVQGRSSIARLGIQTEQAGLIDSGFSGTITFEIQNQSEFPIRIYPGMRVAQVYFFKAQKAKQLYGESKGSKYQMQIKATGSRIHLDPELHNDN